MNYLKRLKQTPREFLSAGLHHLANRITSVGLPNRVGKPWSEYLTWLQFVNAGMLNPGNVYCMDYAIKNLPSTAPILEIGSFCGLSTNVLTYLKSKYGATNRLITCDPWEFEGAEYLDMRNGLGVVSRSEYKNFVKETFTRNILFFSPCQFPFAFELTSDDFFTAWSNGETLQDVLGSSLRLGGPLSFCYIDGNHQYDFARRDFLNCDKYLEPGGFILFDDSADESFGVSKLMPEVKATGRYELIARNPNYFFRKVR